MTFLDTVKAAAQSSLVQFNVFLMEYKATGSQVFAFIEGRQDPCFYRRAIEERLPETYALRFVHCGTRDLVLDTLDKFTSRFPSNPRVIAFIDKDHTDLVPGRSSNYPFLFQTAWYSIENYVCDDAVVYRHCVDSLGLVDNEAVCRRIRSQYVRSRKKFWALMLRPMAWILAARRAGHFVNASNVDVSKLVGFNDDLMPTSLLRPSAALDYLARTCGANGPVPAIPRATRNAVVAALRPIVAKVWLRGKYELWHIVAFIQKVSPAVVVKGKRAGAAMTLNLSNALEVLSAKIVPPPELCRFLATTFAKL